MKKLYTYLFASCILFAGCDSETVESLKDEPETPNGETTDTSEPEIIPEGYAAPGNILILSGGEYMSENAFLSHIAPDGTIEPDAFKNVNSTELGNDGVGLCMRNGKLYILCNEYWKNNGQLLIIADAETLKKEKSFGRESMVFNHPINDEKEKVDESMGGVAALDEQNIFIIAQGVLRFDSTTGELNLIKGAYCIGNAGYANTIESVVSPRGMLAVGDCLYAITGGFWSSTALVEFAKGKNEVNRRLELGGGSLISGMCLTDDGTLVAGTYERGQEKGNLYFIDLKNWTIKAKKTVRANISAGPSNTSGIVYLNGYIYFTGAEETEFTSTLNTTVSRYSLETGKIEKDIIDIKADEPDANMLDCGLAADPHTGYIYVASSKERQEGIVPESNVLIYDCNGEKPRLVRNISDIVHYAAGIYPMRRFSTDW